MQLIGESCGSVFGRLGPATQLNDLAFELSVLRAGSGLVGRRPHGQLRELARELFNGAVFSGQDTLGVPERGAKLLDRSAQRKRLGELSGFAGPVRPTTLGIVRPLARPSPSALAVRRRYEGPSYGRGPVLTLQPGSSRWFMRSACAEGVARNVA